MKTNALALVAVMLLVTACATTYRVVVSLTAVADSAAVAYAEKVNDGLVPPELQTKIATAHLTFRQSCAIARDALIAYKNGGPNANPEQYHIAFVAAQQAAQSFVQLVVQLLPPHQSVALQMRLKSATEP